MCVCTGEWDVCSRERSLLVCAQNKVCVCVHWRTVCVHWIKGCVCAQKKEGASVCVKNEGGVFLTFTSIAVIQQETGFMCNLVVDGAGEG